MRLTAQEPLSHYPRPWIEDLRRDKPYQLDDRIEQLFHEKSVTGRGAWNRLFDETISSLRFDVRGESLPIEPTLNKLLDTDESMRKDAAPRAGGDLEGSSAQLFADHQHAGQGQGDIRSLAGFSGCRRFTPSRQPVERETVDALVTAVREAYPRLSHRYYALKARWFGKDKPEFWDRNAPLPKVAQPLIGWGEAREMVLLGLWRFFAAHGRDRAALLSTRDGSMHRPDRARRPAPSRIRPSPPHTLTAAQLVRASRVMLMTLAHELGHGVHQVMAGHNGALMAPTPLTLAETASVSERCSLSGVCSIARRIPSSARRCWRRRWRTCSTRVVRQIAF